MANWITLRQLSQTRGIDESTLRNWKNLGYVASSTVDDVEMLDDDSLTVYLNALQTEALDQESLENAIKEKRQEYEVLLSRLDDELFLMKTQDRHQKLYHVIMEELGHLIIDENMQEMFLAISAGEPIARVAKRYKKTYKEIVDSYNDILNQLSANTERIVTFRESGMKFYFGRFHSSDPTDVPLEKIIPLRSCFILRNHYIRTIRQLMDFTNKHGWPWLKKLKGLGELTYDEILLAMSNAHYITVDENRHVEWSPVISALIL